MILYPSQAIRALAKLGGFPSEEDLRNALGDPKKVKSIDKSTFVKIMKDRIKTFSAEGGTFSSSIFSN